MVITTVTKKTRTAMMIQLKRKRKIAKVNGTVKGSTHILGKYIAVLRMPSIPPKRLLPNAS